MCLVFSVLRLAFGCKYSKDKYNFVCLKNQSCTSHCYWGTKYVFVYRMSAESIWIVEILPTSSTPMALPYLRTGTMMVKGLRIVMDLRFPTTLPTLKPDTWATTCSTSRCMTICTKEDTQETSPELQCVAAWSKCQWSLDLTVLKWM